MRAQGQTFFEKGAAAAGTSLTHRGFDRWVAKSTESEEQIPMTARLRLKLRHLTDGAAHFRNMEKSIVRMMLTMMLVVRGK